MGEEYDSDRKQLAWENYWEGYKRGYDVEFYSDHARSIAQTMFERYWEMNYA